MAHNFACLSLVWGTMLAALAPFAQAAERSGAIALDRRPRLEDPTTGQRYEMPLEAYDGTAGGYRNPKRPTELLRKLPPGH